MRTDNSEMLFDETNWMAYREANLAFSYAVAQVCKSGDIVWVQDYHRTRSL
jgi:trehalose 6-phosphate synthase